MSVSLTKPSAPESGTTWYDLATSELKMYIAGTWMTIDNDTTEPPAFIIKKDCVDIYSMSWWLDNAKEVGEWLADDNGYVEGGLNTGPGPIAKIKLKNKGDASYFKLKWG